MKWLNRLTGLLLLASLPVQGQVLDIAHRGYPAYAPESTLQAFQNAHAMGADGIEFDVRQTKDNVVVVAHDAGVPALSGRAIERINFSELYMATDTPSLEEVLSFAKQSGQTVWLEIKQSHRYPGIIDRTLSLVSKYNLEKVAVIQSFNHGDLQRVHLKKPELKLLALFSSSFSLSRVAGYVDYIGLPIVDTYLNSELIKAIHDASKRVIFWRRNDRSETKQVLQQFIKAGADGFMLDRSLKAIVNDVRY